MHEVSDPIFWEIIRKISSVCHLLNWPTHSMVFKVSFIYLFTYFIYLFIFFNRNGETTMNGGVLRM